MMVKLYTNVTGVYALRNGKVIEKIPFPKNTCKIADRIIKIEDSFCKEEKKLIEKLYKTGNRVLEVRNPERFRSIKAEKFSDLEFRGDTELVDDLEIISQVGMEEKEFINLLSEVNLEITKRKIKEVDRDQLLIQAVNAMDELDEAINKLGKRIREFYSYSFPELDYLVRNNESYVKLVKEDFENLKELHPELAGKIKKTKKETLGIRFSKSDLKAVKGMTEGVFRLYKAKEGIELYIEESMHEVAPNITALAGPLLGARLISLAGSLKRLSTMPASTIQVLGAEDAFFRFLRSKKKPPKHGVIFTLPEIRSAPKKNRGKISRTFAAKLAIAAKADYFKGEFIGEKLRKDFLKKTEELK